MEPVGQERRGLLGDAEGEADAIGAATLDRAAVQMHECTGATASIALLAATGAPRHREPAAAPVTDSAQLTCAPASIIGALSRA
ncbi:hypothetical protein GCM10022416_45740 [Actinomadura keratinilytica]|uniref:Uncharacterized protein n=1 Tax=Actinomadura keratinilytica TaxID=547461 RepID=A0ABP7Z8R2_9ACTN